MRFGQAEKTMDDKIIRNKTFDEERALYAATDVTVENCRFAGPADGESFLKESARVVVKNCFMDLRYPMWHARDIRLEGCEMTKNCRAALWYDEDVSVKNSTLGGIKALRECRNITLQSTKIDSPEFGWRCSDIRADRCTFDGDYAFLMSKNIDAESITLSGKYSFQYTENVTIKNSALNTKDAFWHAKNATVVDCVLDGEYLGWYSDGLTLVRCTIKGTQPLCYCKRLTLKDCTMQNCDLGFEYSEVNATILGGVDSVKNPLSGTIVADSYGEIVLYGSKYPSSAAILTRDKGPRK